MLCLSSLDNDTVLAPAPPTTIIPDLASLTELGRDVELPKSISSKLLLTLQSRSEISRNQLNGYVLLFLVLNRHFELTASFSFSGSVQPFLLLRQHFDRIRRVVP